MRRLAQLYEALDRTTSTDAKVAALKAYFTETPQEDAAWGLYFMAGGKLKRLIQAKLLRSWCMAATGVDEWLFEESYATVGDLAETVTLLIDAMTDRARVHVNHPGLREWVEDRILPMRDDSPAAQEARILNWWAELPRGELFVFIKLLTGAMRIGVSKTLVVRAIAEVTGLEKQEIAHRLMGEWEPTPAFYRAVISPEPTDIVEISRPYPFYLASPILPHDWRYDDEPRELERIDQELGPAGDWLAEWKYDGIRAQLIRREGRVFLWSRGDENLTERFPEIVRAAAHIDRSFVLDGELLAWDADAGLPMDFGALQTRIGRKKLTDKALRDAPAAFVAYDLLELDGADQRAEPIERRRERLLSTLDGADPRLMIADQWSSDAWAGLARDRRQSRERRVEGLMLKRRGSPYRAGRTRGDWWKWKIEPLTIDAVLVYAQPGHGRRANLLTDYTFAVWDGRASGEGELVTVTKAYSGLTDAEFAEVDSWARRHTVERFGPVRRVEPVHVFELAFEGVRGSTRHKSGVAFRFPRMKRWRRDKPAAEADTLETVRAMIGPDGEPADDS